ncbi:MAG: hypothetical protein ACJA06_001927 [Halocynthiibacter sp.]|jgi:hypothetical protein
MRRNSLFLLVLAAIVAVLLAWISWKNFWWRYTMSEASFEYRTVCVGRYNVDIPKNFDVMFTHTALNGFAIEPLGAMSDSAVRDRAEARARALEGGFVNEEGERINLLKAMNTGPLRIVASQVDLSDLGVTVESYDIEAFTHQNGAGYALTGTVLLETEEADLQRLSEAATGLQQGAGPGFCFEGGHQAQVQQREDVSAFLHDPNLEGFGVEISITEEQHAGAERNDPGGNSSPSARPVSIAGLSGYETRYASNKPSTIGEETVIQFFASVGAAADAGAHFQSITLQLFKVAPSAEEPPYTLEAATEIWARAITSLKRR